MNHDHLDIFSGIGGFSLGFESAGFRTIGFSEIDAYASAVLRKHWPTVPNFGDIRNFRDWPAIEPFVITGGFPCQPFSVAGKRRGASDDRHLWPSMRDVIARYRSHWVVLENVPGIIALELDNVLDDLENLGYSAQPFVVPACAVDAKHRRDRIWIVANAIRHKFARKKPCYWQVGRMGRKLKSVSWKRDWESALRDFRRVDDGLSYGVDRTDTIRNSIVPQIAEVIAKTIIETESQLNKERQ